MCSTAALRSAISSAVRESSASSSRLRAAGLLHQTLLHCFIAVG